MDSITTLEEKAIRYGVQFEGTLVDGSYHSKVKGDMTLREVSDARGRITRVRLLQEFGRVDISYIHATLPDGQIVRVNVGVGHMTPRRQLKGEFIRWAQHEGVYAKGLGLLDESTWSVLH
jgi:hypothetical protein